MGKFEPVSTQRSASVDPFDENRPFLSGLIEDADDWTAGRSWLIRLPLLAYLAYALFNHLSDPLYGTFLFSGITLGIHELGHVLIPSFLPHFAMSAGGTVAQLAAPIAVALIFLRQPDFFGVSVAGMWLSYSMFNMATYMSDAREKFLPLVGVGSGEPSHDWEYMFGALGLLESDKSIAGASRFLAGGVGFASLTLGLWLCYRMYVNRGRKRTSFS